MTKWIPADYSRYGLMGTTLMGVLGARARIASQSLERRREIGRKAGSSRTAAGIERQKAAMRAWWAAKKKAAESS